MGKGKTLEPITVTITGHSLGGALAALTAFDYTRSIRRDEEGETEEENTGPVVYVRVYTYGEPRVGNEAFAKAYGETVGESWRVVNGGDVVSRVPMRNFGYEHEGTEVWMEGGEVKVCEGGEDPSCSSSLSWIFDVNDTDHTKGWFGEKGGVDGTMCNLT